MLLLAVFLAIPVIALALSPLYRYRFHQRGRVFALHSMRPRLLDFSAISVETVRQLVSCIRANGLQIASLSEATGNDGKVAITFDDGYDDIFELLPYLRDEKIPITVFVPTAFIGRGNSWDSFLVSGKRRHLNEAQIVDLAKSGVQLGSHTHNHVDLTLLSDQEIERELKVSKGILQSLTGQPINEIAYPFGNWNDRVIDIAKKTGYLHGLTTDPGSTNSFNIGRISLNRLDDRFTMTAKVKPTVFSGAEFLKNKIISRFSHLTPIYRRLIGSSSYTE